MSTLSEKEFNLLNQLSAEPSLISQRELAKKSGVSIGLLNMVLRKLIHEGYVRATALNKKKIRYFLTPKGCLQIMRRSYQKVIRTVSQYISLEEKINSLLLTLIENGSKKIFLYGDGDLHQIVKNSVNNYSDQLTLLDHENSIEDFITFNLTNHIIKNKKAVINLIDHLK